MQPQLIAGRYQVLRAIGRGGMGIVWLCRDEVLGREVAVKQIGSLTGESATQTKRAMREARSAAALNHPNAVAVYDVVNHDGRPWLVMEYVEGQTLAEEISRHGQLPPQRVADIGAQLAGALARAHERLIVHRDIKPGNVLIDKAGRPKISDFGIARGHEDEQLTQVGFITGTPGFLSPELARGADPHPASDVWALGATLYAAVEGQSPYETRSNPIAQLRAIATERPRPMTQAGALAPAIEAMMHEDPARRWDMATSARRLGGIARITMVMPRVETSATAVMAAPAVEATEPEEPSRALEPTQASSPAIGFERTQALEAAPVASRVVAEPARGTAAVADAAVAGPPVTEATVAAEPVAEAMVGAVRRTETEPPGSGEVRTVAPGPVVPSGERPRNRRWLPLLLVAVLVLAIGVFVGLSKLRDQNGAPARTTAGITATQPVAPKASDTPSVTSAAPSATAAPTTAAPTTAAPTTVAAPAPAQKPGELNKKLENFVKSYYSDVTKNTSRTWGRLAPSMQEAAGGRAGYDGFWRTIDKVTVKQVVADASNKTAVFSLSFRLKNGRTSTETHRFTFVDQGGQYLIASEKH